MALFVQLDTAWPDNVKVIRAGLDGAGLHAMVMCLAKRTETDGVVYREQMHRLGATDELIDRLVTLGLLDVVEDGFRPHDWHDRNPSQGAIAAIRAEKKRSAQAGNHARWKHEGAVSDCERCNPDIRRSSQGAIAMDRTPSPVGSPESESESESESCDGSQERPRDDGFTSFWIAYPRKTDKSRAAKTWRRLTKADRTAALEALPAHARAWRRENPGSNKFIPHPTTWLNGRRWEDEVNAATSRHREGVGAGGVAVEGVM